MKNKKWLRKFRDIILYGCGNSVRYCGSGLHMILGGYFEA